MADDHSSNKMNTETNMKRSPHSKPPFTLSDIKKAIPPHCFQRSLLRSFSYLASDLAIVAILYHVATSYFHLLPTFLSSYVAWPAYWAGQGCVFTGVWMVAHECGHHAFSDQHWLEDSVGFVLHSVLLSPYFSWKISHRRHHANTNSLERDEVFVPKPKCELTSHFKYFNNPPGRVLQLAFALLLGWPLYLAVNIAGRKYDRFASHYDPKSPIYNDRERVEIFASDVGVLAMWFALYKLAMVNGVGWVVCVYGVPLLVMNGWIVTITYLHHTHVALPRYDLSEWDWLRGALATVDRDYGILNKVFHNITDTHVAHHLFSTMPHYHALEATKAIKPVLGEYYRTDRTPIAKALWRETKHCIYVEPSEDKGVFWFNNKM